MSDRCLDLSYQQRLASSCEPSFENGSMPFELLAVTPEERAARAYDLHVAYGVKRGLAQFDEGEFVTRAESRAVRNSGTV